jgi:hypothetical protein
MISAEVIKGTQELLEKSGAKKDTNENFGDFVARRLGISARQAEVLLESLHDGHTVEESIERAGISPAASDNELLIQVAQFIGATVGRLAK